MITNGLEELVHQIQMDTGIMQGSLDIRVPFDVWYTIISNLPGDRRFVYDEDNLDLRYISGGWTVHIWENEK